MHLPEPWVGVLVVTCFYMGCQGSPVMEQSAGALNMEVHWVRSFEPSLILVFH